MVKRHLFVGLFVLTLTQCWYCFGQTARLDSFIDDKERGWKEWKDSRLKLDVPEGAIVAIEAEEKPQELTSVMHWTYFVILRGRSVVLCIDVFQGGPEFIEVMAGKESDYQIVESKDLKTWTLDVDKRHRIINVASKTMRLNTEISLRPGVKPSIQNQIAKSLRPIEPETHDEKSGAPR